VALGAQSVIAQLEKGESGTKHIQTCFRFASQRSFRQLKEHFPRAHIEGCKSFFDSWKYCSKSETRVEGPVTYGPIPKPPKRKGRSTKEFNELVLSGKLEDLVADGSVHIGTYPKLLQAKKLYKFHTATLTSNDTLRNEWHFGSTGTGKTRGVNAKYPGIFRKNPNKWWDGYQGEEFVLIDDVDAKHDGLGYYLKIWADHYPFTAESKGSSMQIRPTAIIVTSNYHPRDIWDSPQTLEPILRRFTIYHHDRAPSLLS